MRNQHLQYCLNCGQALEPADQYCSHCSQRAHNGKLPLFKMFREFLTNQINIDGQTILTFKSIFIPGKLTKDYFAGKRKSQVNPIRLFFVVIVLALASLQFYDLEFNGIEQIKKSFGSQNMVESLVTIDTLERVLLAREVSEPDSIIKDLVNRLQLETDSIDLKNSNLTISDLLEKKVKKSLKVSRRDFENLSPSQIVTNLELTGISAIYFKQKIKLLKDPASLLNYIIRNLAWIFLCYIPVIALVLKLIYIRRNKFYIEHLVFSLHMHTAFILFLLLAVLFNNTIGGSIWLLIFSGFALYLFVGLKRFYQQRFLKTLIKFCILQLSYPVVFTLFIMFATMVSLIFF